MKRALILAVGALLSSFGLSACGGPGTDVPSTTPSSSSATAVPATESVVPPQAVHPRSRRSPSYAAISPCTSRVPRCTPMAPLATRHPATPMCLRQLHKLRKGFYGTAITRELRSTPMARTPRPIRPVRRCVRRRTRIPEAVTHMILTKTGTVMVS